MVQDTTIFLGKKDYQNKSMEVRSAVVNIYQMIENDS